MSREVMLKTEFMRGWNAKAGEFPIFELTPGDGVSIENGVISVAQVPGVAGTYTNPVVTIDAMGRVSAIEDGATQSLLNAAVLETSDEVAGYAGDADALFVLNAGAGRSALYVKDDVGVFRGPAFITGEKGADGVNGADGIQGVAGPKGDTGERGPEGPQGQRGAPGEAGADGSDGLNGEQGVAGPEGPRGPMGAFLTPNAYGTLDEDRITFIRTVAGDYFFLVDPSGDLRTNKLVPTGISGDMSLHLIGWNGTFFTDYGQLTGAEGPQGIQGPQGVQGERGPAGEQGPRGLQGVAGVQGERGIAGQDGSQGLPGVRGLPGLDGAQGPQGERGLQGIQGERGIQGIQGIQGEQGIQGLRGSAGAYESWTSALRVLTDEDSGKTFGISASNSVTLNLTGENYVDIQNTSPESPVLNLVITFGPTGSRVFRSVFRGELWRFFGKGVAILIRGAGRSLLSEFELSSGAKFLTATGLSPSDYDSLQVEFSNFRTNTSSVTLGFQVRQGTGSWIGQAAASTQGTTTSVCHGMVTLRSGNRICSVESSHQTMGTGHRAEFVTFPNDNVSEIRFYYSNTDNAPQIQSGAKLRVFGIGRKNIFINN